MFDEKEILAFWEKNKVFEKSISQRKKTRKFVFYDGPPFATGLPHYGHILASTIKDMIPRYWTMKGFRVDRRWGWDCHGLPIETLVEQELKVSGHKAIEKLGIEKFNKTARSKVLKYVAEWKKTIERIGRFVDFDKSYKTMDPTYMESVWWAFASLYKKGLVYKDSRISLFCPRCETPLSNFEIAMDNSYRDQEDNSVYVKFHLKDALNEYLLIWTTTPWTLPGNSAVAVNPKMVYVTLEVEGERLILAESRISVLSNEYKVLKKFNGAELIGKSYEPPFRLTNNNDAYRIVGADFVKAEEGTGLVHIAPAFGEEDFSLGKKEHLYLFDTLDNGGRFNNKFQQLSFLVGKAAQESNSVIADHLKKNGILWKTVKIIHRYPICWRCQTSLIYKIQPAWFIKVSALKPKMLNLNEKIDWHPKHLKHGRFGNGVETAPDWNISRSRFWGTPLPIWECGGCKRLQAIGSIDELKKHSATSGNKYFIMRHGEAETNAKGINNGDLSKNHYALTDKGRKQAEAAAKKMIKQKIKPDLIFASPFLRTKETAGIVGKTLGVDPQNIKIDPRLGEVNFGALGEQHYSKYHDFYKDPMEKFEKPAPGGENLIDLKKRMSAAILEIESRYKNKTILIVSHEYPLWMLWTAVEGKTDEESYAEKLRRREDFINKAEFQTLEFYALPKDENLVLDLHRPYIDMVTLKCECGGMMRRVPDVFDCWFESGSMPFAERHYPFENKKDFEENFPADFISEYIAQTRGWFYTMHVISTGLFSKPAFKHVVTTGTILSEKGEKLSKSRKNFPDPWLLFNRYGADAMRYYLMSSSVMLAENINFSEKDVDEIYKKYILIIYNVLQFFKIYGGHFKKIKLSKNKNILDRWILSRLHSTIATITKAFDSYEVADSARPLLNFAQDLSLWYVRRSRERVKSSSQDAIEALNTLRRVLYDFARIAAPTTPFLAEVIYKGIGGGNKISVHLDDWPTADKKLINKKLEAQMELVRQIVSTALRKRAEAGIKVRQPLALMKIRNSKLEIRKDAELLNLIKDEVNVKEIIFDNKLEDEVSLDTTITLELREEGMLRDLVREIQAARKTAGLKPKDKVAAALELPKEIFSVAQKNQKFIEKDTNIKISIFAVGMDVHIKFVG